MTDRQLSYFVQKSQKIIYIDFIQQNFRAKIRGKYSLFLLNVSLTKNILSDSLMKILRFFIKLK